MYHTYTIPYKSTISVYDHEIWLIQTEQNIGHALPALNWRGMVVCVCLSVTNWYFIFTARCYASAVYAMALCLSVCVCLSVRHKSEFY